MPTCSRTRRSWPARTLATLALLSALSTTALAQDPPAPVLLIVANQDFYYPDYEPLRTALETDGVPVEVAAPALAPCIPHGGAPSEIVQPDLAIGDAIEADYSAMVIVGGWGAASLQHGFPGTYSKPAYQPDVNATTALNWLIADFLAADKRVGAICFGVSALAWADVNGESPLDGREVAAYAGGGPGFDDGAQTFADGAVATRWHVESNGAFMHAASAIGDPTTSADDLVVDGNIMTAQDWRTAPALGHALAEWVHQELNPPPQPTTKRVLMVIANYHFWFTEYFAPRTEIEAAGIEVEVAAGEQASCFPHWNSGYTDGSGEVVPDMTIADAVALATAEPTRWDAVAFVGGWGSSSYQHAFTGTYVEAAYNGSAQVRQDVNDLVNVFTSQDKLVTALCHGVTVLAHARVNGMSPLDGKTVVAWPGNAPDEVDGGGGVIQRLTRYHVETNGATMLPTNSVGDPWSAFDDVVVDGKIITGESFDSAAFFGTVVAAEVLAQ